MEGLVGHLSMTTAKQETTVADHSNQLTNQVFLVTTGTFCTHLCGTKSANTPWATLVVTKGDILDETLADSPAVFVAIKADIFWTRCWESFQPCLWQQKQVF